MILSRWADTVQLSKRKGGSATLKIDEETVYSSRLIDTSRMEQSLLYKARDNLGKDLFEIYLDADWRGSRSNEHEFIVIGLEDSRLTLMLIEQDNGVYQRVNCSLRFASLTAERWIDQRPVQKLIILS
jgi:hypothetical protein